jgi:hypothetical protein
VFVTPRSAWVTQCRVPAREPRSNCTSDIELPAALTPGTGRVPASSRDGSYPPRGPSGNASST